MYDEQRHECGLLMITLSDAAARKILELLKSENISENTGGVRFGLKGGGCAGFQYFFKPCFREDDGDSVFTHNNAKLFVDAESLAYVDGSHIDWGWVEHSLGEAFKIENPKAGGSCGCGVSVKFDV